MKNFLTLFISIVFSVFLLELFFKVYFPQELNTPFLTNDEKGLILNNKNNEAQHNFSNIKVKYKFGKFHNREYGFDKKKEKILILGDSFTFGWLLKDKDTFVYKLNDKFKNYYFINSATGGWGTSDQLSYLIKFCKIINPKHVLIMINTEDIFRTYNSNLFNLDNSNELVSGKNEIKKFSKLTENSIYRFLIINFHSIRFLKKIYVNFFVNMNHKDKFDITENSNKEKVINFELIKKLYLRMDEEIQKCKANLTLINLSWENIDTFDKQLFFKKNKDFFKKNDIKYLDLNNEMKVIQDNKKKYEIKFDGHPNEKANQYFFEIISNKLESNLGY